MNYYGGNTMPCLWNYAQRFVMNDNSLGTLFDPSTPSARNLMSGKTYGVYSVGANGKPTATPDSYTVLYPGANGVGTVTNDPDPAGHERRCGSNDHDGAPQRVAQLSADESKPCHAHVLPPPRSTREPPTELPE